MVKSNKITVVSSGLQKIFSPYVQRTGISLKNPYSSDSFAARNLRKINGGIIKSINVKSYNAELTEINGIIIVFDSCIKEDFMYWLKENNPDARIIYWYWNPAGMSFHMNPKLAPAGIELWTYSETDAEKHGMRMNTPFYFKQIANRYSDSRILYDVCFIGADKGRLRYVQAMEKYFSRAGISYDFSVMPEHWFLRYFNKKYKRQMPYREVIERTSQSACILDFYMDRKAGLSLRAMESLFLGKKLITNNKIIRKTDFYHPSRIYFLDKTNIEGITEFLHVPVQKADRGLIEKYDFKNWLERFLY